MIYWLEHQSFLGENRYSLDKARERYRVQDLGSGGYLILNWDNQNLWLRFAVMRFSSSDLGGEDVLLTPIFHGEGPSQTLRELRHTFWGEDGDGYVFYPSGKIITAAFKALSEYFEECA